MKTNKIMIQIFNIFKLQLIFEIKITNIIYVAIKKIKK